jgi:hypothetical protein
MRARLLQQISQLFAFRDGLASVQPELQRVPVA